MFPRQSYLLVLAKVACKARRCRGRERKVGYGFDVISGLNFAFRTTGKQANVIRRSVSDGLDVRAMIEIQQRQGMIDECR